jgi:DNA-binding CsgD family transcriptional regulator
MLRFGRTVVQYRSPGLSDARPTAVAAEALTAAGVSPAQRRVLVAVCRPFKDGATFATPATNQQVASELHLSVDAVKTHMRALFEKFGVEDLPQNRKRVALVERALQSGLITDRDL